MNKIDWSLIIGYPLNEAIEYIEEENQDYKLIITKPIKEQSNNEIKPTNDEVRIIGVRLVSGCLELICAAEDWSVR